MTISKHITKGEDHKVFCEDFLIDLQLNTEYRLFGVFDGCSSGINSHFASSLFGNSITATCKNIDLFKETDILLNNILWESILKINEVAKTLKLTVNELLSTIILALFDEESKTCSIISIGDGLISIDYNITKIEQNNTPDYLAYHLKELTDFEKYEVYINKQFIFKNIPYQDITISTDGIFSFTSVNNQITENEIINYFVKDEFLKNNQAMLSRKHNILKSKYNAINYDDLAIIRINN